MQAQDVDPVEEGRVNASHGATEEVMSVSVHGREVVTLSRLIVSSQHGT